MRVSKGNDQNKEKENQDIKNSFSKDFANKYDEIDRLTEQIYSNLT
jgi:hypothetical protein